MDAESENCYPLTNACKQRWAQNVARKTLIDAQGRKPWRGRGPTGSTTPPPKRAVGWPRRLTIREMDAGTETGSSGWTANAISASVHPAKDGRAWTGVSVPESVSFHCARDAGCARDLVARVQTQIAARSWKQERGQARYELFVGVSRARRTALPANQHYSRVHRHLCGMTALVSIS